MNTDTTIREMRCPVRDCPHTVTGVGMKGATAALWQHAAEAHPHHMPHHLGLIRRPNAYY